MDPELSKLLDDITAKYDARVPEDRDILIMCIRDSADIYPDDDPFRITND